MKTGMNLLLWTTEVTPEHDPLLDRLKQIGFDAVEVFPPAPDAVDPTMLRTLLTDNGLVLAAVGTGAGWVRHKLNLCLADAAARTKARAFIRSIIDFAGPLGAPAIIGSMQCRHGDGVDASSSHGYLADALNDLGEHLLAQCVVYSEITLSVGVMILRKQVPEANFEAMLAVAEAFEKRGLQLKFIFDAVRQFGANAAMEVVNAADRSRDKARSIVAFGIGGDELSIDTNEFRPVYDKAAGIGLHRLMHAGEVGGPDKIREAVELLGVERIGHGIAAAHDPALMDLLAERRIPLEVCPAGNICTGALAKQLKRNDARIEDHPLPKLLRHGIPIVLSTDDPAMFHTTLHDEYENARRMRLT